MALFIRKKDYSRYNNPKSKEKNKKPVDKGSVIVAKLSDYEKLPKNVVDHKKESIVVLKDEKNDLGVVYLHGITNLNGKNRTKKKEKGLWEEINKNGQKVFVDINIKIKDSKGNPIKQGKVFQNTGIIISSEEMEKVEKHIYEKSGRKSHSIREVISKNKKLRDKNKKG